MSRILFEVNYIGNLDVWVSFISGFGFLFYLFFKYRKDNALEKEKKILITSSIITIMGICTIIMIMKYVTTVVAYKSGHYVEIEGVVQEYSSNLGGARGPVESFTLDGVGFVCSDDMTWGYRPSRKNGGVIAGNGQHLRIRYIPNTQRNKIVYIEQMMPEEWETD